MSGKETKTMSLYVGEELTLSQETPTESTENRVLPYIPLRHSPGRVVPRIPTSRAPTLQDVGYTLVPTDKELFISGRGLSRSYGIFGGSGSGKTTLLRNFIHQLLDPSSLQPGGLIVDPKREYFDIKEKLTQEAASRVVFLTPETSETTIEPFNIIAAPLPAKDRGQILAASLYAKSDPSEHYWIDNLFVVLPAALESLEILEGRYVTLQELIANTSYLGIKQLVERIEQSLKGKKIHPRKPQGNPYSLSEIPNALLVASRVLEENWKRLRNYATDPKRYVQENILLQVFGEFSFPALDHASARVDFEKRTIYEKMLAGDYVLVVQPGRVGGRTGYVLMALIRLLFQQCVLNRKLFTDKKIADGLCPVFIICDEFHTIAFEKTEQQLGDNYHISQSRAFNCLNIFATQNIAQLQSLPTLGNERWKALLSNFACTIFLNCDPSTEDYAISLAGKKEQLEESTSLTTGREGLSTTRSTRRIVEDVIPKGVLSMQKCGQGLAIGTLDGSFGSKARFFHFPKSVISERFEGVQK